MYCCIKNVVIPKSEQKDHYHRFVDLVLSVLLIETTQIVLSGELAGSDGLSTTDDERAGSTQDY